MRFFFAAMMLLAFAAPAQAGFTVCNKTAHPARVALGRFDGTAWGSQGWWPIAPGKCERLIPAALDARYYYLYASDGGSGTWDGGFGFCVAADGKFTIAGREDCAGRGYERKGFYQVDTGQDTDVTKFISD
ncbi:MAG TPA: DUF1036 domain-containing protein [Rhizomicrobium sp.]|jgi:uncharacterized membrane protein|nr:DUF1036 domain-containing protein [Rhizomicrobium sp.]